MLPEPLLVKLESYAQQEGISVSAAVRNIVRLFLEGQDPASSTEAVASHPPVGGGDAGQYTKMFELLKAAKDAGVL